MAMNILYIARWELTSRVKQFEGNKNQLRIIILKRQSIIAPNFWGSHDIVVGKYFQNQYSGMFFLKNLTFLEKS
jgi:hypothetical protein